MERIITHNSVEKLADQALQIYDTQPKTYTLPGYSEFEYESDEGTASVEAVIDARLFNMVEQPIETQALINAVADAVTILIEARE
jgi:hypothetical protein